MVAARGTRDVGALALRRDGDRVVGSRDTPAVTSRHPTRSSSDRSEGGPRRLETAVALLQLLILPLERLQPFLPSVLL